MNAIFTPHHNMAAGHTWSMRRDHTRKQNKTKQKTKQKTTICFTTLIFAQVHELVKYSLDAVYIVVQWLGYIQQQMYIKT